MKKNKLTGWKNVFAFEFVQTAKSKAFKSSAIIMGIIILALTIGVNVFNAKKNDDVKEEHVDFSQIEEANKTTFASTIYYNDDTQLNISIEQLQKSINLHYENSIFCQAPKSHNEMVDEIKKGDAQTVYVSFSFDGENIVVSTYLPESTTYSKEEAENFGEALSDALAQWKEDTLAFTPEQKEFLCKKIKTDLVSAKAATDFNSLEQYLPMGLCLFLYMCIVMSGQMVGSSVANEKTSKIMELLLTSIRPLAVIVGKVLAMMALQLIEFAGMIVLSLAGNSIGTIIAQRINPNYESVIGAFFRENNMLEMFSPDKVILALVVFVLGFTLYCTLAGLVGSTVNRGEDLSSAMSIYTTVGMIGFFFSYFSLYLAQNNEAIQTFVTIFPISSPFILPAKILLHSCSTSVILIATAVLFVCVLLFLLFVSKIYELVIMYSGNKIKVKDFLNMFKQAKKEA